MAAKAAAASVIGRFDISSTRNGCIKELLRLRVGRRRAREKRGLALVRGRQLINHIGEFFKFKEVFTHEPRESFDAYNAERVVRVEKDVLKHVLFSNTFEAERHSKRMDDDEYVVGTIEQPLPSDFSHGILAIGDAAPRPPRRLLALDGVKHPENMGMLLSTAVALRYDGVFLSGPCIDTFNFKVLEASQAAAWTLPYCFGTTDELLALCKRHRLAPCAAASELSSQLHGASPAVPVAELPDLDARRYSGFCIAVGNESRGVSTELLTRCTRIALPMSELVESLNAGVAGGILMHTLACAWPPPDE